MVTRKLKTNQKSFLKRLGTKIRRTIIGERGYSSIDAFCLENHGSITKPTLYQICDGKRDMKLSTLIGLAESLEVTLVELLDV